jgi:hypothetical protein
MKRLNRLLAEIGFEPSTPRQTSCWVHRQAKLCLHLNGEFFQIATERHRFSHKREGATTKAQEDGLVLKVAEFVRDYFPQTDLDDYCTWTDEHPRQTDLGPVRYFRIQRDDGRAMNWAEIQSVFNKVHPGKWAVEVFPPATHTINLMNAYHLFVFDGPPRNLTINNLSSDGTPLPVTRGDQPCSPKKPSSSPRARSSATSSTGKRSRSRKS